MVAKGFTLFYGIDYQEIFALLAKLNTIRVLLYVVANLDWKILKLDIKNAFLNRELEDELFMDTPPCFEDAYGIDTAFKLKNSLCGLKQSPRAWFDRFSKAVKKHGYTQAQCDHTLFKKSEDEKILVLLVYVGDILLTRDDTTEGERMKKVLAKEFEIKDLGPMK